MMLAMLLLLYVVGVAGTLSTYLTAVRIDPDSMPGGGKRAIVITALAWPLIAVATVIALVIQIVSGDL